MIRSQPSFAAATLVGGPVDREEPVAGVVVAVELVSLAVRAEDLVQFGDLLGARMGSSFPNSPKSGARRRGSCSARPSPQREALRGRTDDERAVAVDRGVEVEVAGGEHRPVSHPAVADHADLSVRAGQRRQIRRRAANIARASRSSGTPPLARAVAAASSGAAPGASRQYRFGQTAS